MTLVKRALFDPFFADWPRRVHDERLVSTVERAARGSILFCKYHANDWKSAEQSPRREHRRVIYRILLARGAMHHPAAKYPTEWN